MTPERTDAERAASDRRRLGQLVALGVVTVAVVGVWILSLTGGAGAPRPSGGSAEVYPPAAVPAAREPSLTRAASAAGCSLRTFPSYGGGATGGRVQYHTNPPTSGPSNPQPAADGIYDTPASTEKLVRALADGRVVIQFPTGASERLRGQLKTLVNEDPRHTILTANQTGMPFAVAATAWRHYVGCNSAGPAMFDALRDFRTAFRDRAR